MNPDRMKYQILSTPHGTLGTDTDRLAEFENSAFNSTRYIRNLATVPFSFPVVVLSTPHGTLGTRWHSGSGGAKVSFQLHTVH